MSTPANILAAEPKPYYDITYSQVPECMKQVDQWLAFRVTWNPATEHFDKTPLNSRGQVENNHEGGESFAMMLEYVKKNPNTLLGFFVRSPFIALDLDGCVNLKTGDVEPWATEIVYDLGSYIELSPSGKGLHIFGKGTKPGNKSKIGSVEIYTEKRGLTVTGYPIPTSGEPREIDVTKVYDAMVSRKYVFGEPTHVRVANERASSGFSGLIHHEGSATTSLLTLLSTGDYTADTKPFRVTDEYNNWVEYPSQSEAIGALLACLAIKHDGDEQEMEQGYLDSHLSDIPKWANGKWDRLRKSEIDSAIELVRKPKQVAKEQPTVAATPAVAQEDVKATSLLIFRTAGSAAIAKGLGYNALAAADFKPPLDPAFNRVAIFSDGKDELSQDIYTSIPGTGARYVCMSRKFGWNLASVSADEAAAFLNKVCNPGGMIADASVHAKRMTTVQVPADSRIEVTDNSESAAQVEPEIVSEMPQSALASTRLGDMYADLFEPNDWPLDLALPALVTAASTLVPPLAPEPGLIAGDDNMVNLYTALIAKPGGGKSQVIEWAAKALHIYDAPIGTHYMEGKWGSAEQLLHALDKNKGRLISSVLINPDELSHLLTKAAIPNSSFPSVLTSTYYKRRQNITIARNKELSLELALSLIGGVVDDEFGTVFNVGTIGGLYDRVLFGEPYQGFQWIHRDFPLPLSAMPLEPAPIPIRSDGSVTEVERAWRKEDSELGRIVEICIRVAKIYASMDGRPVVTGKDLENLKGLKARQKTIRMLRQPNPGMVPDAIFANAVMGWLRAHTRGEWVTIAKLKTGVHCYEMKLGPNVAERCLQAMARADRIETWLPTDRQRNNVPLPSGFAGARPRLGLVRLAC